MRSIQTSHTFPLSSVKPLDGLMRYRAYCLEQTRKTIMTRGRRREQSPVGGERLEPFGFVEDQEYLRCPESGSIFLAQLSPDEDWAELLTDVSRYRRSPAAFHSDIAALRSDSVYLPKLDWIQGTLRLQGLDRPRLMEVVTPPSDFTSLLQRSGLFAEVITVGEVDLIIAHDNSGRLGKGTSTGGSNKGDCVEAAVLLESLDRVGEPGTLLRAVSGRLREGGLIFVTALVCSGFDITVLGLRNLYMYPPDRTNCFSLKGIELLLMRAGFALLEVSTPGVLDIEIVQAHLRHDPVIRLSTFEQRLVEADEETCSAFQAFLQQCRLSSFARIVARKK